MEIRDIGYDSFSRRYKAGNIKDGDKVQIQDRSFTLMQGHGPIKNLYLGDQPATRIIDQDTEWVVLF